MPTFLLMDYSAHDLYFVSWRGRSRDRGEEGLSHLRPQSMTILALWTHIGRGGFPSPRSTREPENGRGGGDSFAACLSHLTIDHISLRGGGGVSLIGVHKTVKLLVLWTYADPGGFP